MPNHDIDSRFLSTLSHDLRGGLHSVQLAMEILRGDVLDAVSMEQLLGDVELARRSLIDTAARSERIICARRIHRGVMPVRILETDLVPPIQQAVRVTSLAEEDAAKRVQLNVPDRVTLRTDPRLVGEIVAGLLDYFLRSVSGGIITVTADAGGIVELSADKPWITDEGNVLLKVATVDPPFGSPMLGLYVAGGAARLLHAPLRTLSESAIQVTFGDGARTITN